jgi:hypothetical protein
LEIVPGASFNAIKRGFVAGISGFVDVVSAANHEKKSSFRTSASFARKKESLANIPGAQD